MDAQGAWQYLLRAAALGARRAWPKVAAVVSKHGRVAAQARHAAPFGAARRLRTGLLGIHLRKLG